MVFFVCLFGALICSISIHFCGGFRIFQTFNQFNFLRNKSFPQSYRYTFFSIYFYRIESCNEYRCCVVGTPLLHFIECTASKRQFYQIISINVQIYFCNSEARAFAWDEYMQYVHCLKMLPSTMRCIALPNKPSKKKGKKPSQDFLGETPKAATNWNWQNGKSFVRFFRFNEYMCMLWYFSISQHFGLCVPR